jgi:mannose-6-phosphate isomerase
VLASEKALALQVHPNRDQAEEGFERENARGIRLDAPERNYLDTNHKPEMLCALEPFWCLAGFRNAAEIAGELSSLRLTATARQIGAFTRSPTIDGLKRLFDSIMLMADGSKEMFVREVVGKAAAAAGDRFKWILELNRQYPGDIGVVSPLFLNLLRLRAGQAVYIAPGMVHAYLRGFGIELMSNSDNVVRGGLSVRHVNIPEFVRILQYDDCPVEPIDPTEVRTGIDLYEIPASDFRLIRIRLNRGFGYISHRNRAVEILICVAGAAILRHPGAEKDVPIGKGDSLLIPADVPEYQIEGQGMLYMAAV